MGPLVPDIISNELNLVLALVIGFFFGFILEQAGFSSTRKLAGLFYGYDFTVLRVFFTAGVTAMIGIVVLAYFGLVEWDLLYINPTFLYSAIIGGLIMGVGFIIGGYCPGTSFAGASIGKIDAIVFIIGTVLGVFIFAELYPYFKSIYLANNYGDLRLDKFLGVNPGLIVFIFAFIAFLAFVITTKIEYKVNKIDISQKKFFQMPENKPLLFGFAFLAISLILVFLPTRQVYLNDKINEIAESNSNSINKISPLELAFRIVDEDNSLFIIDLREKTDTILKSIPGSHNLPYNEIFSKDAKKLIQNTYKTIVFIDSDGRLSKKAVVYANEIGNHRAISLDGGLAKFWGQFTEMPNYDKSFDVYGLNQLAYTKFLQSAPDKIELLRSKYALNTQSDNKPKKKTAGGC
jgi:hypothetical protein